MRLPYGVLVCNVDEKCINVRKLIEAAEANRSLDLIKTKSSTKSSLNQGKLTYNDSDLVFNKFSGTFLQPMWMLVIDASEMHKANTAFAVKQLFLFDIN